MVIDKNSKFFFFLTCSWIRTLGLDGLFSSALLRTVWYLYTHTHTHTYIYKACSGRFVFVSVHISVLMATPVRHWYWRFTTYHRAGNLRRSPEWGGAVWSDWFCRCWYIHEQACLQLWVYHLIQCLSSIAIILFYF